MKTNGKFHYLVTQPTSKEQLWNQGELKLFSSRKLLRIKVTKDLYLTYSENGGNLGLVLKMKNVAYLSIL